MPLVAAAVCPHPPLLVPDVAAGAAGETADLRAACDAAVDALVAARPDRLVVVGAGPGTRVLTPPYRGDFARWGASGTSFMLGAGTPTGPVGPLSLLVGGWLVARRSPDARVRLATVAADAAAGACKAWGAQLGGTGERVALLAMGDGSACRGVQAPGYDDPRAQPYDGAVAKALADADSDALLALDPALSAQLKVAGRAAWQTLAGAAATGGPWRGALTYEAAPYGVAYFVATWTPV